MRRATRRIRGVSVAIVVVVGAVAVSCQPGRVAPSGQKISSAERVREVVGHAPARLGGIADSAALDTVTIRATPGLTDYIENLSDAALVAYLNTLAFDLNPLNSEIEDVECVHANNNSPCLPSESARVLIVPEIGSHKWKHDAIGRYGFIVALIINYDQTDRKERNFEFPAKTRVWWVVDRDPATNALRSRYFKRNYSSTAPAVDKVGITREFLYCDHQHKQGHAEAIAKYVSCSQSLTMGEPSYRREARGLTPAGTRTSSLYRAASFTSAVPVPRRPEIMQLRATWVTCDVGCCSTSQ